jgi:hypothetical protein
MHGAHALLGVLCHAYYLVPPSLPPLCIDALKVAFCTPKPPFSRLAASESLQLSPEISCLSPVMQNLGR